MPSIIRRAVSDGALGASQTTPGAHTDDFWAGKTKQAVEGAGTSVGAAADAAAGNAKAPMPHELRTLMAPPRILTRPLKAKALSPGRTALRTQLPILRTKRTTSALIQIYSQGQQRFSTVSTKRRQRAT